MNATGRFLDLLSGLHFRSGPDLWVVVLVLVPAILLVTVFFYRREREAPPRVRRILAALRALVVLLAVLLAFDPATEVKTVRDAKGLVAVLIDDSRSMAERDLWDAPEQREPARALERALGLGNGEPLASLSRREILARALAPPGGRDILARFREKHDIRIFSFAGEVEARPDIAGLTAGGAVTALGDALDTVLRNPNVRGSTSARIVLLSDGRRTAGQDPLAAADQAREQGVPIHTVIIGDPFTHRDVALTSVVADDIVMVEDLMILEAHVENRRYPEQRVTIEILENGSPVHEEAFLLRAVSENQPFRLQYRPTRPGKYDWIVRVRPLPGEKDTANNQRGITVEVKKERLNVLYVEDLPRYEYRKLKDFLVRGSETFRAQCLLAAAEKGFIQESTSDRETLPLTAFPRTQEELDRYHVLILGDVHPEKLVDLDNLPPDTTRDREAARILGLIRTFVENGGGLALIAGEIHNPRSYKDTDLEAVLPVVVGTAEEDAPPARWDTPWKPVVTPLGRLSPFMQLDPDPTENTRLWEDMSAGLEPLYKYYPVRREARAAHVLARHPVDGNHFGKYILFASQTFGEGNVFFAATDDTWSWFKHVGPRWFNQFWGGVVKHLGRSKLYAGGRRYHLNTDRTRYRPFDMVRLRARVRDRSWRLSEAEFHDATVLHPGSPPREERIRLERVEPGIFEALCEVRETGRHEAWIEPPDSRDEKDRVFAPPFFVEVRDEETSEPVVDDALMKAIAARSGGEAFTADRLDDLALRLDRDTIRQLTLSESAPLRRRAGIPILFLVLLAAEWILRKRFRML